MVFRTNIMGGNKDSADILRNFFDMAYRPLLRDAPHQVFGVKAPFFQLLFQHRVDFQKLGSVHNIADKHISKHRLYSGRAPSDNGQGSGRRNRCTRSVSLRLVLRQRTLCEQRKRSPLFRQLSAGFSSLLRNKGHYLFRQLNRFLRIIRNSHHQ